MSFKEQKTLKSLRSCFSLHKLYLSSKTISMCMFFSRVIFLFFFYSFLLEVSVNAYKSQNFNKVSNFKNVAIEAFISPHSVSSNSYPSYQNKIKQSTNFERSNVNKKNGVLLFKDLNSFSLFSSASTSLNAAARRQVKEVVLSDDCRNSLLKGIEEVANIVRVTLGPRGRNVLLERDFGSPMIVNDGVTIARNIEIKDRKRNAGAKLVKEVACTSDDRAGDGTTSTSILAAEIAKKGVEYVNKGHNPIPLQKGIQKASKIIIEEIRRLAKPVTHYNELVNIATVATSGNQVMGEVIAKAFHKLGKNAATILEDNPALEDSLDFTEGYTFERGYNSPYFLAGEDNEIIEWRNPKFLVTDMKIEGAQSILNILEIFAKNKQPLVIIADDFSTDAMQTLIINKIRGLLKVAAIKAPSFGERRKDYLRDIAIATNATLISRDIGVDFEDVKSIDMMGTANGVVIRKERTSILTDNNFKPQIDLRIEKLNDELEKCTSKFDKEKLSERIAALSGGIARIMIGASTETEQKEKRLRYEDSINAIRAAMETGYVPGGGVTYLEMVKREFYDKLLNSVEETARNEIIGIDLQNSDLANEKPTKIDSKEADNKYIENIGAEEMESEIELQRAGAVMVMEAMKSITRQIANNAGVDGNRIVDTILSANKPFGFGWNARTSRFGDMIEGGVIDPAKVLISAVQHSTSVAGLVLTTEGMLVEEEPEKKVRKKQNADGDDGYNDDDSVDDKDEL